MICVQDLQEDHAGVPLKISDPVVGYRETVKAESSIVALSKSQNKHNRLYVKAMPIDEELTMAIEAGKVNLINPTTQRRLCTLGSNSQKLKRHRTRKPVGARSSYSIHCRAIPIHSVGSFG